MLMQKSNLQHRSILLEQLRPFLPAHIHAVVPHSATVHALHNPPLAVSNPKARKK